ncbi:MAG: helix-turn-helix domain-containing protein [Bacilli bacterium]|nr:helix-turn-helix domain-containing protein [Bacilli bacterium]
MFNKNTFSEILTKIYRTYNNQRDFAEATEVNRAYLSQYINMKLDNPPTPKILEKIAKASHGLTTYEELMTICGYFDSFYKNKTLILEKYKKEIESLGLSKKQIDELTNIVLYCNSPDELRSFLKSFSKHKSIQVSKLYTTMISDVTNLDILDFAKSRIDKYASFYMCPVYGQISAGQPNWAEECVEGRIPLDPDLMGIINPEEHFFLRVNGESMNKVIRNGAFALIHKQEVVENGEIAVVLVNGYDATLKKFTRQGELIILEPQSNDETFKTQVYDKTTPIKILGKYVGKMEINK